MASIEDVLHICSSYTDQNIWEKEDNKCYNCTKMINYIKVLLMELKSVQTVIKILFDESNGKENMDQLQRNASISTSRDSTKADRNYINGKMSTNEGQIVRDNKRWKNCASNDSVERRSDC
jgi:hypothetical protein